MSKCTASMNSDLGNGSFWVEIRDTKRVDRCRWISTRVWSHDLTSDLKKIYFFGKACKWSYLKAVLVPAWGGGGGRGCGAPCTLRASCRRCFVVAIACAGTCALQRTLFDLFFVLAVLFCFAGTLIQIEHTCTCDSSVRVSSQSDSPREVYLVYYTAYLRGQIIMSVVSITADVRDWDVTQLLLKNRNANLTNWKTKFRDTESWA